MSNTTPTWQKTTLNDYLYKDGNIPAGWEAFFNNAKTKSAIAEISKGLTEALSIRCSMQNSRSTTHA